MNALTIVNPAQPPSATPAAGGSAAEAADVNGSEGILDFAELLCAGIGCAAQPAQVRESVDTKKESDIGAGGDTPACDPAALLDAIAAGKASGEPQQLTVAQIAVPPVPSPPALVEPTAPARPSGSATLPVIARDSGDAARLQADGSKGMSQAGAQDSADSPRTNAARRNEYAASPVPVAQAAAREPGPTSASIPIPVSRAELPEHQQEPASQLPTMSGAQSHLVAPFQSANAARLVAHVEQLAQPFGSTAWEESFSGRVVWMAANNVQSAEIRLNPPELGPIEVKLVLSSDPGTPSSASVQFSAAHAATREAIESALPRLREMLLDNGIALGNTTVDARTAGNAHGSGDSGRSGHGATQSDTHAGQASEAATQPRPGSPLRRGNGLVDTFA